MSDVWNCPWCGGAMTEAHPLCVLACKEDADRISVLEAERDALAAKLAMAVEAAEMFGGPDWEVKMDYDSSPLAAIQEDKTDG